MPKNPEREGSPRLLSINQIAVEYGVSRSTVHTYRRNGTFPQPAPVEGMEKTKLRFRADEVAAWFKANPKQQGKRTDLAVKSEGEPVLATDDNLTELTAPALLATIKELKELRAPLIEALTLVYRSMKDCVGDEWAEEWLGEVWTQIPLDIRALAGDEDAAMELKEAQDG